MKRILLFMLLFSISQILPQEYYYYEGRMISLVPRADKFAIVFKDIPHTNSYLKTRLSQIINPADNIIEVDNFIFAVEVAESKSQMDIESYLTNVYSSTVLEGLIKFVTKIYYGESARVSQIPADEIIVRLRSSANSDQLIALNQRYDLQIIRNIGDEKGFLLKSGNSNEMNALELSDLYYNTGLFEFAEPNFFYPDNGLLHYDPNDPLYSQQWALKNTGQSVPTGGNTTGGDLTSVTGIPGADMNVHRAWDHVKGNSQVKIVAYDTGVDSTHPDLSANLKTGYNAHSNESFVQIDTEGHGTCCAGIIGAVSNNNLGVAGIAGGDNTSGSSCQIMSFRITSTGGTFTSVVNQARGFDTASVRNVHVISNSWGGGTPSATLTNAINNCANNSRGGKGTVILFSSGNDGRNPPSYPSYLPSVICVGASTTHDQKKSAGTGNQWWWGGNYGEDGNGDLDIVAPTVVWTTDIQGTGGYNTTSGTGGDYYNSFNGTSAACPNAAGVAGLIFSINPEFTAAQVMDFFYRGADKIGNVSYSTNKTYGKWNEYYGYGRVNAYNSVRLAAGADVTPPTIVHENIGAHSSTYPTTITAEIVDQNGGSVPTSGNLRPKIFYMFNKNGAGWPASFDSAFAVSNVGNTFTFKIPGAGHGTEVRYFIKASDAAGNTTTFPRLADVNYPFTTCYFAIGNVITETRKLTGWSFDNSSVISPAVNFPTAFNIVEARIRIYLRHTWMSDFGLLMLWSPNLDPNNDRIAVFERNYITSGSTPSGGINGATTHDGASMFWREGSMPWTNGNYKPDHILRGLNGTNAQGNWRFIGVDHFSSDPANFDSINIMLSKLDGSVSPSARLDSPADSIIDFGTISFPSQVDKNFYLHNRGNSTLTVGSINFTGSYSWHFSVISSPLSSVAVNDSGLITVRMDTDGGALSKKENLELISAVENAVMEIPTNDPSKPVFKVSLQSENPLPVELVSFTGNAFNDRVELKWVTATEINNYGFEVHRKSFVSEEENNLQTADWENVGFVEGYGNSNSVRSYSFTDRNTNGFSKIVYRLKQVDTDGQFRFTDEIEFDLLKPIDFALFQNYPNPFNPVTTIKWQAPVEGHHSLKLFDMLGQEVMTLIDDVRAAGYHSYEFDAEGLPSGIYFYRIVCSPLKGNGSTFTNTKKMIILK